MIRRESSDCGWWTIYFSCLSLLSTFSQNYLKPKVSSSLSAILQNISFSRPGCCNTLWRLKEKISKHFVATTFALRMSFSMKLERGHNKLMGWRKWRRTPSATNGVPVSVAMLSQFTRRCPDYNLCNLKAALEASLEIQISAYFETFQS